MTHDQEEALSLSDRVVVMSEGRMEQVGTPFEIYNFPTTAFVASFVGTLNILPGAVVDAGRGRSRSPGSRSPITGQLRRLGGREVRVALRPEMASLGAGAGSQSARREGLRRGVPRLHRPRIRIGLADEGGTGPGRDG